jgi:(S)-2-hydroxyglutarate dehydrogenase
MVEMNEIYDVTVIGSGIIGSSASLKILEKFPGKKVLVIEKEPEPAMHQTGRNSGVIHSGIYYKPGSLKALTCKKGIKLLHEFCEKNSVPFEITGKVIIASLKREIPILENIYSRGMENKIEGLKLISKEEVSELEPEVRSLKGLYVPTTGIIDYRTLVNKYIEVFKTLGGEVKFSCKLKSFLRESDCLLLKTSTGIIKTRNIINCAGLYSDGVARIFGVQIDCRIIPFRGEYYKLRSEKNFLVKNLIYPVPDPKFPFLGVHFTRMFDGERKVGPNAVPAFKREGYNRLDFSFTDTVLTFSYLPFWKMAVKYWKMGLTEMYRSFVKNAYLKEINKMIPSVEAKDLIPATSGVRAQALDNKGNLIDDFKVFQEKNMIHVLNAPSPAATASLSIAEKILELADKGFSLDE